MSKEPAPGASLKQQAEELRRSSAFLRTENEMFESFLSRLSSLSLASPLAPQVENDVVNMGRGVKSESSGISREPPDLLKPEQKYYIAVCELEEMRKEPELELQQKLRAAVEVSDMRLAEIKRERRDFEQFVAKTRQTTPVVAQRAQQVIRYIECKIKAKSALIERMRRRNAFLRKQVKKQQRTGHREERTRDAFRKIDLEYLKQNNIQYQEAIQNIQEQILCQRMRNQKSQQGLNTYKEKLKGKLQESEALSRKIASLEEKLSKIREKQQKVEKEQAHAKALNKKLKAQLANYRVPDVMKYVEAKAENDQLRQTIKALERKARIAAMASKSKNHGAEDSSGCSTSDDH